MFWLFSFGSTFVLFVFFRSFRVFLPNKKTPFLFTSKKRAKNRCSLAIFARSGINTISCVSIFHYTTTYSFVNTH